MKTKLNFKFWKFCNSASCLHMFMLSQKTAANNIKGKIINKKAEDFN